MEVGLVFLVGFYLGCLGGELEMKREKRICNICKGPMFSSLAGEWINGKFVYIHEKCKKKETFEIWKMTYPDGTKSTMTYDPILRERDKMEKLKGREKKIMKLHKLVVNGLVNGLSYTSRDERLNDINFWRNRSSLFNAFSLCVLNILTNQTSQYSEKDLKEIAKYGYEKVKGGKNERT